MNEYIKGAFLGALVICILMMAFPKQRGCQIVLTKGSVTHVYVGDYKE